MAIAAPMKWYVRPGGSQSNGAGYDGVTYPGGVNYCDQDTAQLSLTDMATAGVTTTITSLTAGFTSLMVGNVIRVSAGTNWTAGSYVIATYVNATTVTVDRAPTTAAGVSGVGSIGGASDHPKTFATGGAGSQPTLTNPSVAGNFVYVRGSGSNTPSVADYTFNDYYTWANGSGSAGYVTFMGYNGRPMIVTTKQLAWYQGIFLRISNFLVKTTTATYSVGVIQGQNNIGVDNVWFDQNGQDMEAVFKANTVTNCKFFNTGATQTAGTHQAITTGQYNPLISGNTIDGWRGGGVLDTSLATIENNLIINCKSIGIEKNTSGQTNYYSSYINNTMYNNTGDGVKITGTDDIYTTVVRNNIIVKNGGYGLNLAAGSQTLNNLRTLYDDYNNYGTGATANTSGAINNGSLGTHDVQLDPQFVNAGSGNFAVGINMKAIGFPSLLPEGLSTSYVDLGGLQRQESGGGSSTYAA